MYWQLQIAMILIWKALLKSKKKSIIKSITQELNLKKKDKS